MEAKGLLISTVDNPLKSPTVMPGYLEVPCGHCQKPCPATLRLSAHTGKRPWLPTLKYLSDIGRSLYIAFKILTGSWVRNAVT